VIVNVDVKDIILTEKKRHFENLLYFKGSVGTGYFVPSSFRSVAFFPSGEVSLSSQVFHLKDKSPQVQPPRFVHY
jgi:hypothetical protein